MPWVKDDFFIISREGVDFLSPLLPWDFMKLQETPGMH